MRKLLILSLLCLTSVSSYAETPEEKGLAIAQEANRRDNGFGDYTAAMTMTLRNKQGDESTRRIRLAFLEVANDGDRGLTIFDEPADVKGTALLTHSHKTGDDDQWLYLPALKRVKRITSTNKSGSFMGSEFAFEDLSSQEVEKYRYKHLRDETYEGQPVFVSERVPVSEYSGYTRQIVWVDQAEYRPWKIEYYDRKSSLLKTLVLENYKQYLGKHWRPNEMLMTNHQTGKSTVLKWSDYKFRVGLKPADFNQDSLKRVH